MFHEHGVLVGYLEWREFGSDLYNSKQDTNVNESVYFVAKGSLSLCQLAGGEDLLALIAKRQLSLLWQFDLKRLPVRPRRMEVTS
jgi:hypothetical protein